MSVLHSVGMLRLSTYLPSEVAFRIRFPSNDPKELKKCLAKAFTSCFKEKKIHYSVAEPMHFPTGLEFLGALVRFIQPAAYPDEGTITEFIFNSSALPSFFPPVYYAMTLSLEDNGVLLTVGTRRAIITYILAMCGAEVLSVLIFYLFLYMVAPSLLAMLCLVICLFVLPNLITLFFLVLFLYAAVVLAAESFVSAEFLDKIKNECAPIGDSCGVSGKFV